MTLKITKPLLVCLAFAMAACASDPPHGGRPSLFISPAGEPFRATPGQGDGRAAWLRLVDPTASGVISADALVADWTQKLRALDARANALVGNHG